MAFMKKLGYFAAPAMLVAMGSAAVTGCGDELGDLPKQCGLECAATGVAEGNFAISGVPNIDAFFAAVVRLNAASAKVTADIQGNLDAIAVSLELPKGSSGADIKAALVTKFEADLEGGISIKYAAPKCEISASATVEATAACDVDVDPGSVSATCEGKCEAEVSASGEVDCSAEASVVCEGTAPNFACEGTCEGSCELEAGASCEGTCKGTCDGTCTVTNADGSCNGSCEGTCEGSCELTAGASCSGKCTGKCTYTPPDAKCDASASASCDASAMADAKVECSGSCEGKVEPPEASAECQASAKAEAEVSAECTPPMLEVDYELSATLAADADATLEFEAWLTGFQANFSALLASTAKAEILGEAAIDLAATGNGAVSGIFDNLAAEGDLKVKIGAACAVSELPVAVALVTTASEEVAASVSATGEIFSVVSTD